METRFPSRKVTLCSFHKMSILSSFEVIIKYKNTTVHRKGNLVSVNLQLYLLILKYRNWFNTLRYKPSSKTSWLYKNTRILVNVFFKNFDFDYLRNSLEINSIPKIKHPFYREPSSSKLVERRRRTPAEE